MSADLRPDITSTDAAPDAIAGNPIVYTATASGPGSAHGWAWTMVDDAGTGVTIDELSGVMSGGDAAAAGSYTIRFACGGAFGISAWSLDWTVTL